MPSKVREFRSPREPVSIEDKIARIYRAAWREIKDSLFGLDPTSITPAKIARIRGDVKTTVRALDYAASSWTQREIPRAYTESARTSRVALEIIGRTQMKRGKKSPISPIASKTLDFFLEANRSIIKTVDRYISVVDMAKKTIERAAIQEFNFTEPEEAEWLKDRARFAVEAEQSKGVLKKDVKDHLQDLVVDGKMIEINGKNWAMDRYADLVARTSLRDAATDATRNLCDQFENDLVEVSDHATDCDVCEEFEGNVYSLSGTHPRYPAIEEYPPFHPNCEHSILPTSDEAITAREWEKQQQPEPPAPPRPPSPPPPAPRPAPPPAPAAPAPAPAPAPAGWKPAASKAEAEAWVRKNIAPLVDYSKISLEGANTINKTLALLAEKGIKIDGVGSSAFVKRHFATRKGRNFAMAVYSRPPSLPTNWNPSGSPGKIFLAYNPNVVGTTEKWARSIQSLERGNVLKGISMDGMVEHEFGHIIDFLGRAASGVNPSMNLARKWNALFASTQDRNVAQAAVKAVTGSYIWTNTPEFFAECFRLYKGNLLLPQLSFVEAYFKGLGW